LASIDTDDLLLTADFQIPELLNLHQEITIQRQPSSPPPPNPLLPLLAVSTPSVAQMTLSEVDALSVVLAS